MLGATSRAWRSLKRRSAAWRAASSPVMPTTSGIPADSTAARLSTRASGSVKSMATFALASASARSAVTGTATGPVCANSPASRPSEALAAEASAPVSTKSGDSRMARTRQRPTRPLIPSTATGFMSAPSASHASEKLAHALEPGALPRIVTLPVGRERGLELAQEFPLVRAKLDRRLHDDAAEQVAGRAAAHRLDAFLAQAENPPRLGADRHLDRGLPLERRDLDAAAEGRRREADRHLAGKVRAVALEDRVLPHHDLDVQVPGGAAVPARFALAREPDAVSGVDAGRNLDRQPLVRAHAAVSGTNRAGILDDRAATLATRAGLLDREDALADPHLAGTGTGFASHRRVTARGARAFALGALLDGLEIDLRRRSEDRLLEIERELVAQVGAAEHCIAPASSRSAEDVAEHVAEDVAEGIRRAEARTGPARRVQPCPAVLVVSRALLRIGQDLVGLLGFLESLLGFLVVGVAVRMVFHGQAPVSLGDGFLGGVSRHAQHLVEVTLRHGAPHARTPGGSGPPGGRGRSRPARSRR